MAESVAALQNKVICKWKGCKSKFNSDRGCLNHLRKDHHVAHINRCLWDVCGFKSGGKGIRNHIKRHLNIVEAYCLICPDPVTFKWRFDLSRHLQRFHNAQQVSTRSVKIDGFIIYVAEHSRNTSFLDIVLN